MDVQIYAVKYDQGTEHLAEAVRPALDSISLAISGDYGGSMEHLWIDVEFSPGGADHRPQWPFRFQRSVRPSQVLTGGPGTTYANVGHYSVRPDYYALAQVPPSEVVRHVAHLIFESTETLRGRRNIGKFDIDAFRGRFSEVLVELDVA